MSGSIDHRIGDLVRRRRRALGLTQAQLGRRAGLAHQTIHNIECGAVKITVERLCLIAQALEIPVSLFFEPQLRPPERPYFTELQERPGA